MLEISKLNAPDHITLQLKGQVDASNSVELDDAIQTVVNEGNRKILIDGNQLDYISSAGLGVFMSYLEDFQERNIHFVIYGLSEKVTNVFHILGLDQLITLKDNKDEALQSIL